MLIMPMKHNAVRAIAFCAMMAACASALLILSGNIPGALYLAPAAASILVATAGKEYGALWGGLTFAASALLALMISADRRMALLYLILIGYYPLLKPWMERLPSRLLSALMKLTLCNLTMSLFFRNLLDLMLAGQFVPELPGVGWWVVIPFVLFGDAMFLIYDHGVGKVLAFYCAKIRPFLRRPGV